MICRRSPCRTRQLTEIYPIFGATLLNVVVHRYLLAPMIWGLRFLFNYCSSVSKHPLYRIYCSFMFSEHCNFIVYKYNFLLFINDHYFYTPILRFTFFCFIAGNGFCITIAFVCNLLCRSLSHFCNETGNIFRTFTREF